MSNSSLLPQVQPCFEPDKESKVKLNLEIRETEDVTVIHCRGRIAYRDEAVALHNKVAELLPDSQQIVLELSGVEMIDSAGLGELVGILMSARASGCSIKLAAPRQNVREVLLLTNLASVFEIHPTVDEAVLTSRGQMA
jgi:anti-sigma B factor antagonist